jgi:hypothetical protein
MYIFKHTMLIIEAIDRRLTKPMHTDRQRLLVRVRGNLRRVMGIGSASPYERNPRYGGHVLIQREGSRAFMSGVREHLKNPLKSIQIQD